MNSSGIGQYSAARANERATAVLIIALIHVQRLLHSIISVYKVVKAMISSALAHAKSAAAEEVRLLVIIVIAINKSSFSKMMC